MNQLKPIADDQTVTMMRRVAFSSGHRYWIPVFSDQQNRSLFGKWASPFNHGHNYVLYISVSGRVEPATGMVVNIKVIDEIIQRLIVNEFDGKSINDEIEFFRDKSSSLENIIDYIWKQLAQPQVLPPSTQLMSIRLDETPLLYAEKNINSMTTLTRIYEFAAAHRLDAPSLSPAENIALFGKCNNPAGHGHNYLLEVTVQGVPDPQTGMLVDIEALDRTVHELVVDRYDHKNLNSDIPEFTNMNTTSEIVTQTIFSRLAGQVPAKLHRVRLHETARNIFEVNAE